MNAAVLRRLSDFRRHVGQSLMPSPASAVPGTYWRALHYYNLYRLIVAGVFVQTFVLFGPTLTLGARNPALFFAVSIVYAALCMVSLITIRVRRPAFNYQIAFQILTDIAVITLLMDASGGIKSGLGLVLVASLAATGLVSRGRLSLYYAALASLAILGEAVHRFWTLSGSGAEFLQTGLVSISYFATALLAGLLASYAETSGQLAEQRGIDLENLAQVNQHVIQDMDDGVLVLDGSGIVKQSNRQAEGFLGTLFGGEGGALVGDHSPGLAERYRLWQLDGGDFPDPLKIPSTGKQLGVRFVALGAERTLGALAFLEDLSVLRAQAQQIKLAALGRLTANIAHEIRNPLSAISHAAQLLGEEEDLGATQVRLIEIIMGNAARLDKMVEDVLQLNRRDRAQHSRIEPQGWFAAFVGEFCQAEGIPIETFSIEIETTKAFCFDRTHLNQVMWNLSRNAWRHSRQRPSSIRLYVSAAHRENIIQLDVIDDGDGVAPEVRPHLFEPFFTTESLGTGLGLYVAREVCEANGATLDFVEVAPGGQFRICARGVPC
ncbi:MAG: ATP-binding protein [Betaproteobacteria bacterium]|nr:ATP-binding protein [Betaproteobacteria bacterium]